MTLFYPQYLVFFFHPQPGRLLGKDCLSVGSETKHHKTRWVGRIFCWQYEDFHTRKDSLYPKDAMDMNKDARENDDQPKDFGLAPISQKTILYLQLTSACQVCSFSFGIPDCLSLHSRYNNIIWSAENG